MSEDFQRSLKQAKMLGLAVGVVSAAIDRLKGGDDPLEVADYLQGRLKDIEAGQVPESAKPSVLDRIIS